MQAFLLAFVENRRPINRLPYFTRIRFVTYWRYWQMNAAPFTGDLQQPLFLGATVGKAKVREKYSCNNKQAASVPPTWPSDVTTCSLTVVVSKLRRGQGRVVVVVVVGGWVRGRGEVSHGNETSSLHGVGHSARGGGCLRVATQ